MAEILDKLDNKETRARIAIERKILNRLDGGCQLPLGVFCPSTNEAHVSFSNTWSEPAFYKHYNLKSNDLADDILEELQALKSE